MGVSDRNLKLYLPFGLREPENIGFFGFEGRHYSLFESMGDDFAPAADLQQLITLLAYKYAVSDQYTHRHLPDDPSSESERRLPFFCAALGLHAFNVRLNTTNNLMHRLAAMTKGSSASRHSDYIRLELSQYRLALLRLIEEDGADCIELLGLKPMLEDLRSRIQHPELTACGKLMNGIVQRCGKSNALAVDAREFNIAAEHYYRVELKQKHLRESLRFIRNTLKDQTTARIAGLHWIFGDLSPTHFLNEIEDSLVQDNLKPAQLRALLNLVLSIIHWNSEQPAEDLLASEREDHEPPIYRSAYPTSS